MRRKWAVAAGVLLVAAVGVYSAYWAYAARFLRQAVESWAASAERQGLDVQYGSVSVGGYPFDLRLVADDVRILRADGASFTATDLTAGARPWNYFDIRVASEGSHRLALPVAGASLDLVGDRFDGQVALAGDGRLRGLEMRAHQLSAAAIGLGGPVTVRDAFVTLGGLDARPAGHTEVGLSALARLEGIGLPEATGRLLGPAVDRLSLDVAVLGPVPDVSRQEALQAWREDGGTVEVSVLDLVWGPLTVAAEGTLALDRELQPEGALTAQITGYRETLDALARAGWMRDGEARLARIGMDLLAEHPAGGGVPVLTAPITIQNRLVTVGPVPLMPLPRVEWGF